MESTPTDRLLALLLLEVAELRSAVAGIHGLLRGSPLQRDDELEESLARLFREDVEQRLDRLVLTMREEGLEDALAWAMAQRSRET
jgi:hypothetical protein